MKTEFVNSYFIFLVSRKGYEFQNNFMNLHKMDWKHSKPVLDKEIMWKNVLIVQLSKKLSLSDKELPVTKYSPLWILGCKALSSNLGNLNLILNFT